ncbi:hypothetical protein BDF14DRAFT_1882076 [Spinellus fusiger]|nr:hypothetical protein BDF14DRAFT_1882076 [Spinellus fusiger]
MPNTLNSLSTYTSRMRVTSDGRPHAKDLHDLLAAFIIQRPLTDHRVFFRSYPGSFTTEEAIETLSHLQFTHLFRMPDPHNVSRQVSTKTTTTFSMTRDMAKFLCQLFLSACLIDNAADPLNRLIQNKAIWVLTCKGKCMFIRVVVLDRQNDKEDTLAFTRTSIFAAFQHMVQDIPCDVLLTDEVNVALHYRKHPLGIDNQQMKTYEHAFYGSQCVDWLCESTTVIHRREAEMVASEFILCGWIKPTTDKDTSANDMLFKTTRHAIYYVTERGCQCLGWDAPVLTKETAPLSSMGVDTGGMSTLPAHAHAHAHAHALATFNSFNSSKRMRTPSGSSSDSGYTTILPAAEIPPVRVPSPMGRILSPMDSDTPTASNYTRLQHILNDPLLRLCLREFMKANFCEENICFWFDYYRLHKKWYAEPHLRRLLWNTQCYKMYITYLSPCAPSEVNINHVLRQEIVHYASLYFVKPVESTAAHAPFSAMGSTLQPVGDASKMAVHTVTDACLQELLDMYSSVSEHVCRTMAQDTLPKFVQTTQYREMTSKEEEGSQTSE